MAKERRSAVESLAARVEVAHDDVQHLPGFACIALGDNSIRDFPCRIHSIPVRPRSLRQASASAASEAGFLSDGDASIERPIGDLAGGRAQRRERIRTFVLQGVGDDGVQNPAERHHRQVGVTFFKGDSTIGVSLFEHRPNLRIVHEFEAPGRRLHRRRRDRTPLG